jgi:carbon-monoxide dehydrogenase medium subunit
LTDKAIDTVAAEVQDMIAPSGNVHTSPDYQRHIAGVLVGRAIRAAHQRIGHAA